MKYFYVLLTILSLSSLFMLNTSKSEKIQYYDMTEFEIIITPSKD